MKTSVIIPSEKQNATAHHITVYQSNEAGDSKSLHHNASYTVAERGFKGSEKTEGETHLLV